MRIIENIFKYIAITLLVLIIVTIMLQIIAREIIYFPVSWTQEVATFSFLWMSLIGAALGVRNTSHVSIDIFVSKLPTRMYKLVAYLVELSIIFLMIIFGKYSLEFSLQAQNQMSSTLGISMKYIYMSFVVFSLLTIVFSLEKIFNIKRADK